MVGRGGTDHARHCGLSKWDGLPFRYDGFDGCLRALDERIAAYDHRVAQVAQQTEPAQRLMQVPGVGPATATALVASVGDARTFKNGRQFAAWGGLVPRQHSSGGTRRLGQITKRGDVYLRTLLIHGARAVLRQLARRTDVTSRWVTALKARRGFNKALVALAARSTPAFSGRYWPPGDHISQLLRVHERPTAEGETLGGRRERLMS